MSFLDIPYDVSKMGMRQHELILRPDIAKIPEVMKSYDWTCCKCGVRMPNYMQIHHEGKHVKGAVKNWRPICVFCHDMEHPVWAANRKRIVPIDAPDLTQVEISRMAWSTLTLTNGKSLFERDLQLEEGVLRLGDSLNDRRETIASMTGAKDADAVIQGIYSVGKRLPKEGAGRKSMDKLLARLRFAPAFLFDQEPETNFTAWAAGGFVQVKPVGIVPDYTGEIHLLKEVGNKAGGKDGS